MRVAAVNGTQGGCKTVSAILDVESSDSKLKRAVVVGVEPRRKAHGLLIEDEQGATRAHIFFDARTLRQLSKGERVQVDWSPVGEHLMVNIALTITSHDEPGESESYPSVRD
jgi:hypothetical protein